MKKRADLTDERLFSWLIATIFGLYLFLLAWAIFFKFGNSEDIKAFYLNFSSKYSLSYRFYRCIIPFAKIVVRNGHMTVLPAIDFRDALNAFVFIPFGFFVSYLTKQNTRRTVLYALLATIILEGAQFFTLIGAFASKDIVTNICGAWFGALIGKAYAKMRFSKAHTLCAIASLLFCIAAAILAAWTLVANFDGYLFVLQRRT